ncbi:MAG: precorrin-2 C(20)-methyltransferase [Thermoleophilia bacterium]
MTPPPHGTLYALGMGPGDPGLVTVRAAEILREAKVVAYPADAGRGSGRAFRIAEPYLSATVKRVPLDMPMTDDPAVLEVAWDAAVEALSHETAAGSEVAYLCLGDTLLYGSFGYLLARYRGPVEVVPGVISPVAAASVLQKPLVEGREPLVVVPDGGDVDLLRGALALGGSVVIMKPSRLTEEGVAVLVETGAVERAWVTEDVTLESQRVYRATPQLLAQLPYFSVVTVLAADREARE